MHTMRGTPAGLRGSLSIPFSELFTDTVRAHGVAWAWAYYTTTGRMAPWEFKFWLRATFGGEL